jgi:VCBS repeat-containing protein
MGYSKYIGRVGALALTLGIGTALAVPAAAETSTGDGTETSSTSSTESGSSAESPSAADPSPPTADDAVPDDGDENLEDDVEDDLDDPVEEQPAEEFDEEPVTDEDFANDADDAEIPDTADNIEPADDYNETIADTPARQRPDDISEVTSGPPAEDVPEDPDPPAAETVSAEEPTSPSAGSTIVAARFSPDAPAPAPRVYQPVTPIGVLIGAPFKLFTIAAKALNMLFSPPPTMPADQPVLLAVLAFVRREIHRSFFNHSPHAVADTVTTGEDVATTIPVLDNDTDRDGDTVTITEYTQPANGTVVLNPDGTFTYTPNADFNGTDTFTYTISDGASPWHVHNLVSMLFRGGHAQTATVTITVDSVNDAPTLNPDTPVTDPVTGVVTGNLNAHDADNDPLTFEVTTPARGTVTVVDGGFVYTPTPEARAAAAQGGPATDTFTVTVTDGNGGSASQTITVAVTPNVDNIAIELRWGERPRDLDSHLVGPGVDGGAPFHVYYVYRNLYQADGTLAANLAADDTNGFGPEVTTIYTRTPGEYLFYVHRFSTDAEFTASEATVTVRDSVSGLNETFTISGEATGSYWSVFTFTISETGLVTVTAIDTYSDTAPTLPVAV